jgi:GTP cyclohydrolase IA
MSPTPDDGDLYGRRPKVDVPDDVKRRGPHPDPLGRRRSRSAKACSTRPSGSRARGPNIRAAMARIRRSISAAPSTKSAAMTRSFLLKDIPFQSHCEHHMAPIIGKAAIAYLAARQGGRASASSRGCSTVMRAALQVQERLTAQVADCIWDHLQPKAVAVVIEASHSPA